MRRTALSSIVQGLSRQGRVLLHALLPPNPAQTKGDFLSVDAMCSLARDLISTRGEASGVAIAEELLRMYREAEVGVRMDFLKRLAVDFNPDCRRMQMAWDRFSEQGWPALASLARASEAPRQELFRRLNLAQDGAATLIGMRESLLTHPDAIEAGIVEADLFHVLQSWFNRGFLTMQSITWSSPASLLERVIRYEAVHDIGDWIELRRRLEPRDRRCFGFFHPAMPQEPLIFVEVALTNGIPDSIDDVLASPRPYLSPEDADTATFYSISNCQPGLLGVSFGHFLIKQVATDLQRELPNLRQFATLSPMPGFIDWLSSREADFAGHVASIEADLEGQRERLMACAVEYLVEAKDSRGRPLDPVARFHLGNGARLERLNWMGNMSVKGRRQSAGLMVNYLYELRSVERLHENYVHGASVALGGPFRQMLKKMRVDAGKRMESYR